MSTASELAIKLSAIDSASPILKSTGRALADLSRALDTMTRKTVNSETAMRNAAIAQAKSVGGMLTKGLAMGGGVGAGILGAQGIGSALAAAKEAIIGMNSKLETTTLQFETLMGSSDQAKEHVESLFKIAANTPFETGPIINASRLLQTFGGRALNTEKELLRVGDAAAATGASIDEVAFWFGRAYSQIRAGQPFGEAAARLQEMGILSADARMKLDGLVQSGALTAEVWQALTADLDRFGGAMQRQAGTAEGLGSTIRDALGLGMARAGAPLFVEMKAVQKGLADFLTSASFNQWTADTAASLETAITTVNRLGTVIADNKTIIIAALGAMSAYIIGAVIPSFAAWAVAAGAAAGASVAALLPVAGPVLAVGAAVAGVAYLWQRSWGKMQDDSSQAAANIRTHTVAIIDATRQMSHAVQTETATMMASYHLTEASRLNIERQMQNQRNAMMTAPHNTGGIRWESEWEMKREYQFAITRARELAEEARRVGKETPPAIDPALQALLDLLNRMGETGNSAQKMANDVTTSSQSMASQLGISTSQIVAYLVSIDPAAIAAAASVEVLRLRLVGLQDAQEGMQQAMRDAQKVLQGLQNESSRLSQALSDAKNRLQDLASPRLVGMGALEDQIAWVEYAIKRLKAQELGLDISSLLPSSTAGRAFLSALPLDLEALQKMLDRLQLQKSLRFDDALRELGKAAKDSQREMTFDEALKGIGTTKAEIAGLTGRFEGLQAAIAAQQASIAGLQDAMDGISQAMKQAQKDLANAESKQQAVNQSLSAYYSWLIEVRPEVAKLGGEWVGLVTVVDNAAQTLLVNTRRLIEEESEKATAAIEAALRAYRAAQAEIGLGLMGGTPPPPTAGTGTSSSSGAPVATQGYGEVGSSSRREVFGVGGGRASESGVTEIHIHVAGSVITADALENVVVQALTRAGRRGRVS